MHDHSTPQLIQIEGFEFTKPQVQVAPTHKPHDHETHFMVGLDIGSTTVKAVIVEGAEVFDVRKADSGKLADDPEAELGVPLRVFLDDLFDFVAD